MHFQNTYASLSPALSSSASPAKPPQPSMLLWNTRVATLLGLAQNPSEEPSYTQVFSGAQVPVSAQPVAQAYAGHQFGHFVPGLGDGRALLLGDLRGQDGVDYDIHLKGAGRTPFSRQGDGKYALPAALREYLLSEAMHALGIPTTHTLCITLTGETVWRHQPHPGAVLTRVASTHVRVGTFEYFAHLNDTASLQTLTTHVGALWGLQPQNIVGFLEHVAQQWCVLLSHWMRVGFIHGVMNTDNASIAGLTLDYGPCAFMDTYHPHTVFSSIDHNGRYAFENQLNIAQWNYARLLEALLPLIHTHPHQALEQAQLLSNTFNTSLLNHFWDMMRRKCGLYTHQANDMGLIQTFLDLLQKHGYDYTHSFRHLANILEGETPLAPLKPWVETWQHRISQESPHIHRVKDMNAFNPAYIPRNSLVEHALAQPTLDGFNTLLESLQSPYTLNPQHTLLHNQALPSQPGHYQTFCGT
jgi:uncharacterized protein YdiU (UPF0061 family)